MRKSLNTGFYSLERGFVPAPGKPLSAKAMIDLGGDGHTPERVVGAVEYRRLKGIRKHVVRG